MVRIQHIHRLLHFLQGEKAQDVKGMGTLAVTYLLQVQVEREGLSKDTCHTQKLFTGLGA
jgi:hypothetical protein